MAMINQGKSELDGIAYRWEVASDSTGAYLATVFVEELNNNVRISISKPFDRVPPKAEAKEICEALAPQLVQEVKNSR